MKTLSLEQQRQQVAARRGLAMLAAGLLVWLLISVGGLWLPPRVEVWVLFIGTGSIAYLGLLLSRFTGENPLNWSRPKNAFDTLLFLATGSALLVWVIAIPLFRAAYPSLPLSVGILNGLMWPPLSWILHGVAHTGLVLAAWYAFPAQRFVVIPFVIAFLYAGTIAVLERRWRQRVAASALVA